MPDPRDDHDFQAQMMRVSLRRKDVHVPIEALRDPGLTLAAKGLMAEMCALSEGPIGETVAGDERDLATQELIERGYLVEVELDDDPE